MTPTIVEIKLEDVLTKIDNRLERIEGELTDIKVSQAQIKGDLATFQAEVKGNLNTIKTELTLTREDVKDLKSSPAIPNSNGINRDRKTLTYRKL
jgi:archaellum component FlaC